MKIILNLIFTLFLGATLNAEEYSAKVLFKNFKGAVVKINVFQQGVHISSGAGFFIDGEGRIATNRHVVDDALFVGGNSLEIVTYDKKIFKNFTVGKCYDKRSIDLCILKIDHKPEKWIKPSEKKFDIGEKIYVIGHPRSYDWSLTEGVLSSYREMDSNLKKSGKQSHVEQIQVSAPVSPGNSGGPVISSTGELVGVTTWIRTDVGSQNLNFGVSASELFKFNQSFKKFRTRKDIADGERVFYKNVAKKEFDKMLKPVYGILKHNEKAKKWEKELPRYMTKLAFEGFNSDYITHLYGVKKGKCKNIENNKDSRTYHCPTSLLDGYYFKIIKSPKEFDIVKKFHGMTREPVPLAVIRDLPKKTWEKLKKTLTKKQITYLHKHQTKPYKCNKLSKKGLFNLKDQRQCSTAYYNYGEANYAATEEITQAFPGDDIVQIVGYTTKPNYNLPIFHGAAIGQLLLKKRKKD